MSNLTGVRELDIPILRYLDVDTIISILKTKNREITESILSVIRLYKQDDQEYLAKLLNWTEENKNDSFSKYLIGLGADIHLADYLGKKGEYQYTYALRWAAEKGHYQVVKYLVENGSDTYYALQPAVKNGHLEVVKLLIEKGVDIHDENDKALLMATNNRDYPIIKLLIEKGANIHVLKYYMLLKAAANGDLDIVKLLLENGVDVQDNRALKYVMMGGYYQVVEILIDYNVDIEMIISSIPKIDIRKSHIKVKQILNDKLTSLRK